MRPVTSLTLAAIIAATTILLACGETEEQLPSGLESPSPEASASPTETPGPSASPSATPGAGTPSPSGTPGASPTETSAPTASATPVPLVPYSNAEWGFRLEYPSDLAIEDLSEPTHKLSQLVLDFRSPKDRGRGFAVVIGENSEGLTAEEWVSKHTACFVSQMKPTTIADLSATECPSRGPGGTTTEFSFRSGQYMYSLSIALDEDELGALISSFEMLP